MNRANPPPPVLIQPRKPRARNILIVGGLLLGLTVWHTWFRTPPGTDGGTIDLSGGTQGTWFTIRIVDTGLSGARRMAAERAIKESLAMIERQMSLWEEASEINRFNRAPENEWMEVSDEFATCAAFALDLAKRSGGAFDPTLRPLLRLWGFGPDGVASDPPAEAELRAAAERTGWHRVAVGMPGRMSKTTPGVELDLNAVAKGYTSDIVAQRLMEMGIDRFLVEIGGEIAAAGLNANGGPWRIGIDEPRPDAWPGERLAGVIRIDGGAVATSGGYRNRRRQSDASTLIHILDPRTGRPIAMERMSVTVTAPDCMTADGLATALFVMGPDEGLPWLAEHYPAAAALFLSLPDPERPLEIRASPNFPKLEAR